MQEKPPKCECRECANCRDSPGPAAYIVERAGEEVMVCTKCRFIEDKIVRTIAAHYDPRVYAKYDALGTLVLKLHVQDEREKNNGQRKATQN